MKSLLVVLVALLASACTEPVAATYTPAPLAPEPDTSGPVSVCIANAEIETLVEGALADWAQATAASPHPLEYSVRTGGCESPLKDQVLVQLSDDENGGPDPAVGATGDSITGLTYPPVGRDGATVTLYRAVLSMSSGHAGEVTRHELGHAWGLAHNLTDSAVMAPSQHDPNANETVTSADVKAYELVTSGQ